MYSEPKKYRKKPVVIEAIRWTGENWPEITTWHESSLPESFISFELDELKIKTLEGVMTANVGDWIIRGVHGEFYPCKDEIFKATYELANPIGEAFESALETTNERHGGALKKLADTPSWLTETAHIACMVCRTKHHPKLMCPKCYATNK